MGMPNAYKVANEMINDKMKDNDMYDDYRKIKNSDIVVIKGEYDKIEDVFRMGDIKFGKTIAQNLDSLDFKSEQTVFVNCPGNISRLGVIKLRNFVRSGGFLFTTDWALKNVVELAFPGFIRHNGKSTSDEVVKVEVLGNDPFLIH